MIITFVGSSDIYLLLQTNFLYKRVYPLLTNLLTKKSVYEKS